MKAKIYTFIISLLLFSAIGCSEDEQLPGEDFVVAFKNGSEKFTVEDNQQEIKLVFSTEAPQSGYISINFTTNNLNYGNEADFTTTPEAIEGIIEIPFEAGSTETNFSLQKISTAFENALNPWVEFSITQVSVLNAYAQGNISSKISNTTLDGGSFAPNVGGPNQPNQVYVDLSNREETSTRRDKWDLAFYSGEEFRVKLNASLYMMAAQLETTNIDEVSETDVEELEEGMAFLVSGSDEYVDFPSGDIEQTAIAEVSTEATNNKVYLIHMGSAVGTSIPETGSVAVSGEARGWKKIRVLQENGNYILQYADLNATTHQEVIISKNEAFNFTFFSLTNENIVNVEPEKNTWDLNFTVATEVLDLPDGGMSAYGFADYVSTNTLSNVSAYQIMTSDGISYEDFSAEDINEGLIQLDQRTIGANWRSVFEGLYADRFYIIKDTEDNYYKLKFTALVNENGLRGYPEFKYELLN